MLWQFYIWTGDKIFTRDSVGKYYFLILVISSRNAIPLIRYWMTAVPYECTHVTNTTAVDVDASRPSDARMAHFGSGNDWSLIWREAIHSLGASDAYMRQ